MISFLRPLLLAALMSVGAFSSANLRSPTTRYDDYFRKFTKRYFGPGFPWRVFKAQAMAESGLDSTASSNVGARGLMQLMPATFDLIRAHRPDFKGVLDAQSNISAGIAHDRDLWVLFHRIDSDRQHYRFMMGAYNAGEGTIMRAQHVAQTQAQDPRTWNGVAAVAPEVPHWRYHETLGYVSRIASYYQRLRSVDAIPEIEMDLEAH
jgi:membrane-bound lytic murein transglycosylase MltF